MGTKKSQEKKEAILKMALEGGLRPKTTTVLGQALANYLDPKSTSYDADFKHKLVEERPDWFQKGSEKKKAMILSLAKQGKEKSSLRGELLTAFRNYTNPKNTSYDRIFHLLMMEVAPHWLVKKRRPGR